MKTRRAFTIDINEVEKYYHITGDGMVFSKIKNRWLKPRFNVYGYIFYSITKGTGIPYAIGAFAHTLVALKYIGKPPTNGHEIDHLDGNKCNNHYSNLQWRTHSENILMSYSRGRRGWWDGKHKPSPDIETRMLMSNAKKKSVKYSFSGRETIYDSIDDACAALGTYRKKVYLCIKDNKPFNNGVLSFVEETIT